MTKFIAVDGSEKHFCEVKIKSRVVDRCWHVDEFESHLLLVFPWIFQLKLKSDALFKQTQINKGSYLISYSV